ncbi:MAG: hypothetical protein H6926_01035 [Chromatiales bacterium]|nr:hypothetical protein [Gammaproteobacteria bacterium]MCP5351764.1 hypothetical protein [Chromatiales bacterium]
MAKSLDYSTLEQAPLPQMVEKLGTAIANAQFAMDQNAIRIARMLTDPEEGVQFSPDEAPRTLLELGFTPTFYQLTEATIDAKVTFHASRSTAFSVGGSIGVNVGYFAASVNASYSSKYSFDVGGSSSISARFVSVPPPAPFSDLLADVRAKKNAAGQ